MNLALLLLAATAWAGPPRAVTIELTQTRPYCGGAAPTPEVERDSRTPHPLVGAHYLLRAGSVNTEVEPLHELVLDEQGRVTVLLQAGDYCIVGTDKRSLAAPPGPTSGPGQGQQDAACLAEQQRVCDLVVHVDEGEGPQVVQHNFVQRCFWRPGPCYVGPPIPPPPSAPPGR